MAHHSNARALLAKLGTTFEKHYACANMSASSHSVIYYTGQHITQTKLLDNTDAVLQQALSPDLTTVGDRMRQSGYYTALKGNWHMGDSSIPASRINTVTDLDDYGFSDWSGTGYVGSLYECLNADPLSPLMR